MRDGIPWEGHYTGAGEESEEEGAAETMLAKLTLALAAVPLCRSGGRMQSQE